MEPIVHVITHQGVNCYLAQSGDSFVLIDTGFAGQRQAIMADLNRLGCCPGMMKLIVLTHADSDHSGNVRYLAAHYSAPVAMHPAENLVAASGDMAGSRSGMGPLMRLFCKPIFALVRLKAADRFVPDLALEEGFSLLPWGLDATVLHLPGHSDGHCVVRLADGRLISGDLFMNSGRKPKALVTDPAANRSSRSRLANLGINAYLPGHGPACEPERMEAFFR